MEILNLKTLCRNITQKNDTMNELGFKRVYSFFVYPKGSKMNSDKRFVNIDNGCM